MKLLKYELYKLAARKLFWGMLIAVLVTNLVTLFWLNRPEGLSHSDTKAMFDTIRTMQTKEKLAYLEEQKEYLNYYILQDSLDVTRELAVNGTSLFVTYDDVIAIENELLALKEKLGSKYDFERQINAEAAGSQVALIDKTIGELIENYYIKFLNNVEASAESNKTLNIFGDDNSFAYRNIEQTQVDFAQMRDITIRYDVNLGVGILFNSPATDILLLIFIVMTVIILVTDEKDKRLFSLIKTTPNGMEKTIITKMLAMAICLAGVHFLVFLSNLIFAELTTGLGDVTRSVQSIPEMAASTLRIDLAQFIGLYFIIKTIGLIIIGLAVKFIALNCRQGIITLIMAVLFAMVNYTLSVIPVTSSLNWLRFLNFYTLIQPYEVMRKYFNLNFLGYPVHVIEASFIFALITLVIGVIGVYFSFTRKRELENNKTASVKKSAIFLPFQITNWRWYELKKNAILNKTLIVLLIFIGIQIYTSNNMSAPPTGFENNYVKTFLLTNEGELTEEIEAFILTQKESLLQAQEKLDDIDEQLRLGKIDRNTHLSLRQPFDKILAAEHVIKSLYERYEYVKAAPNAKLVYDSGYAQIFGLNDVDNGLQSGIKLIAVLILGLCGLFSIEYQTGMYKVLNTTKYGHRKTIKLKLIISLLFTLIAFVFAYLPDILYINKYYGYSGLNLPVSSIAPTQIGAISTAFGNIPIWGYITILFLFRLLIFIGLATMILAGSLFIKHNLFTALCTGVVFLIPLAFHKLGITFLDGISLYRLITVNGMFMGYSLWQSIIQAVVFVAFCGIVLVFIYNHYGRSIFSITKPCAKE